jgi:thioredoxin reductase (NADPH)
VVDAIDGDNAGLVDRLALRNLKTGETRDLAATGVFIFIGFKPNTGIIADHVEHDASGYVITDWNMQTSIPGLFAAGDVRVQLTRQVTTAVGDATTAAIAAEKYLTALRKDAAEALR